MLEHQIEKLTERVAAVEARQTRTNELLADILAAIRVSGEAEEPVVETKPSSDAGKKNASSMTEKPKEPAAETDGNDEMITLEDARSVLVTLSKAHGRAAALEVLDQFGAKKIGDMKPGDYSALLEACADYGQKEAA